MRELHDPAARGKGAKPGLPAAPTSHKDFLLNGIKDTADHNQAQAALEKLREDGVDTESLCLSLITAVEIFPRLKRTDVLHNHSTVVRRKIRNLPKTLRKLSQFIEASNLPELLRLAFFFSRAQSRNTLVECYQKCGSMVSIEKNRKYGDLFECLPILLRHVGEDLEQLLCNPGVGVMNFANHITWIVGEVKRQSGREHYPEISDLLRPLQSAAKQREIYPENLKTLVTRERAKQFKRRQA